MCDLFLRARAEYGKEPGELKMMEILAMCGKNLDVISKLLIKLEGKFSISAILGSLSLGNEQITVMKFFFVCLLFFVLLH